MTTLLSDQLQGLIDDAKEYQETKLVYELDDMRFAALRLEESGTFAEIDDWLEDAPVGKHCHTRIDKIKHLIDAVEDCRSRDDEAALILADLIRAKDEKVDIPDGLVERAELLERVLDHCDHDA